MKLQKVLKVLGFILPIVLFFSGALLLRAYWTPFAVDLPSINATLGVGESLSKDFVVSHGAGYEDFEGETPYDISYIYLCNKYDSHFNCIDPIQDLCPYISLTPKDGETIDTGFTMDASESSVAHGQLNYPDDVTDTWNVGIKTPCFEGECPADYDPIQNGAPLPQSSKGKTFNCSLSVDSSEAVPLASNYFNKIAYADNNTIDVSVVFGGSTVCTTNCYSNVLFLPGIQGSILKTGSDTLWPPTALSNDVSQLALTDSGDSVNDVYADGVVNTFSTPISDTPIYGPFSNFMDSISGNGNLINQWLPLAYDWRFSPDQVLTNGIKTKNGTLDVMSQVEALAASSKTGKVTIIAHSMGGLLGKEIIKRLQDEDKDNLIDSFVMVGTPQLGTPETIGALLHGDGEGIAAGFIAEPADMRKVGQNMQSAYNLLPSQKYFASVSNPVMAFDPNSSFTDAWRNLWGQAISTYSSYLQFMTGTGVARSTPADGDTSVPEVLRSDLMTNANTFHSTYDNYQFPAHINVVQIAGWGNPTTKTVEYKTDHGLQGYDTIFTSEGDGTVVYPSAISSNADATYFFNLPLFNKSAKQSLQHRDLLSNLPIQDVVEDVIEGNPVSGIDYISTTKPSFYDGQIIVSTHSPVVLGAYDSFGNFTGIDPNQDLSADILSVSENIPGSTFTSAGGNEYIFLPKQGTYKFVYKGIGNGPTTVSIDNFANDVQTPIVSYTDIPTTPTTTATFNVQSAVPEDTTIQLDVNSDGDIDKTITSDGTQLSLDQLLNMLKQKVQSLTITDKLKQNLLKKIGNLEDKITKKKIKNAKILATINNKISKQAQKGKIDLATADDITTMLDQLEAESDSITFDPGVLAELKTKIKTLTVKDAVKNTLLGRVAALQAKQGLVHTLSNLSQGVIKKAQKGKISDSDAQSIVDLIDQITNVI